MIRMAQIDITQATGRDFQNLAVRDNLASSSPGDFMAEVQRQIRSDSSPEETGRQQAVLNKEPDYSSREEVAVREDVSTEAKEVETEMPRDDSGMQAAETHALKSAQEEIPKEVREDETRTDRDRPSQARGEGGIKSMKEQAMARTSDDQRPFGVVENVRNNQESNITTGAEALQSLKSLNDNAPEITNLEKNLRSLQENSINVSENIHRPEVTQELRIRVRDALRHLESNEESEPGTAAVRLAARNQLKSLSAVLEQQAQGETGNRKQDGARGESRAGVVQQPVGEQNPSQVFQNSYRPMEKLPDGQENRDSSYNTVRMVDSQMNTRGAAQGTPQRMPLAGEQMETILNNARFVVRDGKNGSFVMNLYPETLGRVNVNLGLEDGVIVGRFMVESREAREAMLENIDNLRLHLEEAGIQVGSFQVNVRGERERLVQELQEAFLNGGKRPLQEATMDYEINTYRRHDGALDVIA